jgi:uncharacterized protein (TIGR01244 family)
MRRHIRTAGLFAVIGLLGAGLHGQVPQVSKDPVEGITNFARVETTVACGGATKPEALARLKQMGFVSVVNLRLPTEAGADVEAEAAAAQGAGLKYVHLPLNSASPDPAVVDRFLQTLSEPGSQPAFIHCATGNRAAALWMIKRVQLDGWDVDRAAQEAAALGLTNAALKQFALDYIQAHRK